MGRRLDTHRFLASRVPHWPLPVVPAALVLGPLPSSWPAARCIAHLCAASGCQHPCKTPLAPVLRSCRATSSGGPSTGLPRRIATWHAAQLGLWWRPPQGRSCSQCHKHGGLRGIYARPPCRLCAKAAERGLQAQANSMDRPTPVFELLRFSHVKGCRIPRSSLQCLHWTNCLHPRHPPCPTPTPTYSCYILLLHTYVHTYIHYIRNYMCISSIRPAFSICAHCCRCCYLYHIAAYLPWVPFTECHVSFSFNFNLEGGSRQMLLNLSQG